jgi:DNA-3-methyladenine glycosylase I
MPQKTRCAWVNLNNPLYIKYHDEEWGRPVHDDRTLFEFLVLEWAQAGLSWETILKRRDGYKKVFCGFDIKKCAELSDSELEEILKDKAIIRNRLKVFSVRKNALVFLQIQSEFGSFFNYLWGFVWAKVVKNHPKTLSEVPAKTELSDRISKDLKKRGMSFVGSTIIYAYLQAVWVVDDHIEGCFCKSI